MELLIYFETTHEPFDVEIKGIAPIAFKMNNDAFNRIMKDMKGNLKDTLKIAENTIYKRMEKKQLENEIQVMFGHTIGNTVIVDKLEFVIVQKEDVEHGEYYAHEYDKWVAGKRTTSTYSNGYIEHVVECLDESLIVVDGVWEHPNHNGMGDRFI